MARGQGSSRGQGSGARGQGFLGGHGFGEGDGGAGGLEEDVGAGGGFPAGGGDFDELTIGIGEIEEDLIGDTARAGGSDAAKDGKALPAFVVMAGAGFEEVEEGVELVGSKQEFVAAVELVEEPIAEGGRADGVGEEASTVEADADEGLAVTGGELDGGFDDGEELGVWIGLHDVLSISG